MSRSVCKITLIFISTLIINSCIHDLSVMNKGDFINGEVKEANRYEEQVAMQTPKKVVELSEHFSEQVIPLPTPYQKNELGVTFEQALAERRSVRTYRQDALSLKEVSQLVWAGQGITDAASGYRTAPSAGATFPLELYVIAGNVEGLAQGVYRYHPFSHELHLIRAGDKREPLFRAALSQSSIRDAPASLVFSAVYERTTQRYGERGIRYVHMEVGHAAQNVYLQAVSLGLGTVVIGAFNDQDVADTLQLPENEIPLYILPVGIK
jgi:SagB-type dehydrogenase family enzyme